MKRIASVALGLVVVILVGVGTYTQTLTWAPTLGVTGLLVVIGLVVWSLLSGCRRDILGAGAGAIIGLASGWLILSASNQSGAASFDGFYLSFLLGVVLLALGILGAASEEYRDMALFAAGTMLSGAIAASQLLVFWSMS